MKGYWEMLGIKGPKLNDFWEQKCVEFLERETERRKQSHFFDYLLKNLDHMLIIGPTGSGKSKLVETLVRHLVQREDQPTIVMLDPGGHTARQLEYWALSNGLENRTLILDPDEEYFYLGFNPLRRVEGMPLSLQASFVQQAILIALEIDQKDSVFYMPVLEKILYFLSHLLIETGFTFTEASYLLANNPNEQAVAILERTETEMVKSFWLDTLKLKSGQRQQMFGVAQARLLPFITSQPIQKMMGQRERVLDFTQFIESGNLLLANVEAGSSLSSLDAKLLANLLISAVVRACFARPAYSGKPVYLFIEECGEGLVGTEVGKMLRRARKQNLKVILVNQDISSLQAQNPVVFYQLWQGTGHKAVFGDLPFTDLEVIAPEFFGEELNLKEIKDEIERTYFEPVESETTITSYGRGSSSIRGRGGFGSRGQSEMFVPLQEGLPVHRTVSEQEASSFSEGSGEYESWSETEVPFYEYEKRRELSSRAFYPLDELLHRCKAKLKSLPKRRIALKRRGHPVEILKVPYIPDTPRPTNYDELKTQIFRTQKIYATIEEIEAEREERLKSLQAHEPLKKWQKR